MRVDQRGGSSGWRAQVSAAPLVHHLPGDRHHLGLGLLGVDETTGRRCRAIQISSGRSATTTHRAATSSSGARSPTREDPAPATRPPDARPRWVDQTTARSPAPIAIDARPRRTLKADAPSFGSAQLSQVVTQEGKGTAG